MAIAREEKGYWIVAVALVLVGSWACRGSPPAEAGEPVGFDPRAIAERLSAAVEQPLAVDDPQSCVVCHGVVYAEWRESMHSRAHHAHDPIYAALRALRLDKGQKILGKCESCHAPRAGGDYESEAARAGVSCSTCHNVQSVHTAEMAGGAKLIVPAEDDTMRSARDLPDGSSPVHGTGKALDALADGKTLCLACHGKHVNPAKVPVCTTGSELEAHAEDASCVSCHMPDETGPSGAVSHRSRHKSHRFPGPHRAYLQDDRRLLASGVELEAALEGGIARVTLRNRSGHGFPSGFPGRLAVLEVVGLDDEGRAVWRNFADDPVKESPEAVLDKVYLDGEGRPVMPPFAKKLGRDNRLGPDEVRTLELAVPDVVKTVRARLSYRLLPPSAAEQLGLRGSALAEPVEVATATSNPGT